MRGSNFKGWPAKPAKRNKPEAHITLSILKYLRFKGYIAGKIKTVGGRVGNTFIFDYWQWTGLPDILCFMPRLIFIECKAEGGVQSPHQIKFQQFCEKAGVPYLLVYSLEELMSKITELEHPN